MLPPIWVLVALTSIAVLLSLCALIQGRRRRPSKNAAEVEEETPNDTQVDKEAEAAVLSASLRTIELRRMQRDIRTQSDGTYAIYLKGRVLNRDTHHEAIALWQSMPEEERLPWKPVSKPKRKPQRKSQSQPATSPQPRAYSGGRAVQACDPVTGKVVRFFPSLAATRRAGYPSVSYAIANDKEYYGFRWRNVDTNPVSQVDQPKPIVTNPVSQVDQPKPVVTKSTSWTNQPRPVEGCDPVTGRIVKRFPSIKAARLAGYTNIRWALQSGHLCKKLYWRDAKQSKQPEESSETEKPSENQEQPTIKGNKVAVGGSRLRGGPIERRFSSIRAAARAFGMPYTRFYQTLDTAYIIGGLYWRRLDERPDDRNQHEQFDDRNWLLSSCPSMSFKHDLAHCYDETTELDEMMAAWSELVGNEPARVAQVIAAINEKTDRGENPRLATILAARYGERSCVLGNRLRHYRNRIHRGRRFVRSNDPVPYWQLEVVTALQAATH